MRGRQIMVLYEIDLSYDENGNKNFFLLDRIIFRRLRNCSSWSGVFFALLFGVDLQIFVNTWNFHFYQIIVVLQIFEFFFQIGQTGFENARIEAISIIE